LATEGTARLRRNQKQVVILEEFCSGFKVIPEIPPSPPFSKGGLGGISETRFPTKYSSQNLEGMQASSTESTEMEEPKREKNLTFAIEAYFLIAIGF
jgi:hypothetical protein